MVNSGKKKFHSKSILCKVDVVIILDNVTKWCLSKSIIPKHLI